MKYNPEQPLAITYFDAIPAFLSGSDTPRDYLERCLETIAEKEPTVKAWVTLNEEGARQAANEATQRYKAGKPLSAIDGMPLGIKDLIHTKDMPTKMGSPLYENNHTYTDSSVVQALRSAGAVVLGKTVTTEMGMSHPGPTTNPYDSSRTPGGSSSGSAAAVGAGMVPAAIGTQVIGSIIRPAGYCANYALKPTYGAINRGERQGYSQSHHGVHAGSLEDMWQVAIEVAMRAGGDPGHPGLFGTAINPRAERPTRLIVMQGEAWSRVDPLARTGFEKLVDAIRASGVQVLWGDDNPLIRAFEESVADCMALCRDICGYELRWVLENLVERHPNDLSDSLTGRLELSRKMTVNDYRALLGQRDNMQRRHAALAGLGDALISLSSLGPAPKMGDATGSDPGIDHTTGSPIMNAPSSALWAPTVTQPLLAVNGMPVGIQLLGQLHTDERLVRLAAWLRDNVTPVSVH
ncbi:amidase [Pollutimonas thiosulfatoxidans]|uniref:Amidase n=1 Tax=Pollutimonas thiosulfatoxidans TaxID=2028345 RepID=A0A410GEN3_9BURK|nr:amidase [Pollutimonas thiosulfatoxidans]QAA94751.1 amidase [Pollutimonas thiosulfatoxidans]